MNRLSRRRQHVAYKPLVSRHINKTEPYAIFFPESKTQIDSDPPALLFRQPVRMRPRQRLNERRLAVVDVPRGPDNHAFSGISHSFTQVFDQNGVIVSLIQFTSRARRFIITSTQALDFLMLAGLAGPRPWLAGFAVCRT